MMLINVFIISILDITWVVLQFLYWLLIQTIFQQFMYFISGLCIFLRETVNVYMYVTYYNDKFVEKVRGDFGTYFGRAALFPFYPWYWWFMYMFENDPWALEMVKFLGAHPYPIGPDGRAVTDPDLLDEFGNLKAAAE